MTHKRQTTLINYFYKTHIILLQNNILPIDEGVIFVLYCEYKIGTYNIYN